ncbi:MAG: hypothetical protein M1831_002348 [Alyxoria varia]|nr:MAG: hypothetical protein M1831_002348 [Alyxoria varia]
MPSDDQGRERNPLVAFRRFVDDQFAAFRSNDPFTAFEALDKKFEETHREMLDRFSSSYERATNPERQRIEQRMAEKPRNNPPPDVPKDGRIREPGLLSKVFGTIGKTTKEGEVARATFWEARQTDKPAEAESTIHEPTPIDLPFNIGSIGPLSSLSDLEQAVDQARKQAKDLQKELEIQRSREEHQDNENIMPCQSTYSPLRLEAEHGLADRVDWRRAFEDLMSAERGEPLGGNRWGGYVSSHSRGGWLTNLFWRGHLDYNDPWHQELFGMRPPNYWDLSGFQRKAEAAGRDLSALSLYDLFPHPKPHTIDTRMTLPRGPPSHPKKVTWESGQDSHGLLDSSEEDACETLGRILHESAETDEQQGQAAAYEEESEWSEPDNALAERLLSLPGRVMQAFALSDEERRHLIAHMKQLIESSSALADEEIQKLMGKGKQVLRDAFDSDNGIYRVRDLPDHLQRLISRELGESEIDDWYLAPEVLADVLVREGETQEEKLSGATEQSLQRGMHTQSASRPEALEDDSAQSKILATLTTVERRVMPDGSTTERRIFKRRFADGREESEENTETMPRPSCPYLKGSVEDRIEDKAEKDKSQKSGSWFWSS